MMTQTTLDLHCKDIREAIKQGDGESKVTYLNYLKNHASSPETRREWAWIGQCLVMHGWLTVDASNNFQVKGNG